MKISDTHMEKLANALCHGRMLHESALLYNDRARAYSECGDLRKAYECLRDSYQVKMEADKVCFSAISNFLNSAPDACFGKGAKPAAVHRQFGLRLVKG